MIEFIQSFIHCVFIKNYYINSHVLRKSEKEGYLLLLSRLERGTRYSFIYPFTKNFQNKREKVKLNSPLTLSLSKVSLLTMYSLEMTSEFEILEGSFKRFLLDSKLC